MLVKLYIIDKHLVVADPDFSYKEVEEMLESELTLGYYKDVFKVVEFNPTGIDDGDIDQWVDIWVPLEDVTAEMVYTAPVGSSDFWVCQPEHPEYNADLAARLAAIEEELRNNPAFREGLQ